MNTAAAASAVPTAVTASSTGTASSSRIPPAPPNAAPANPAATARPRSSPGRSKVRSATASPGREPGGLTPAAREDTTDLRSQGDQRADHGGAADQDQDDHDGERQTVGEAAGVERRGAGHQRFGTSAAGADVDRGVTLGRGLVERQLLRGG